MSFRIHQTFTGTVALAAICFIAGCANQPQTKQTLEGGYAALQAGQFDEAMTAADKVLQATPTGPGTAEAHYLRGQVFEKRVKGTPAGIAPDLQRAREEYTAALATKPLPPNLEANIHAGVANVAYYQDDYATALAQWSAAIDKLPKDADKITAVYRMGQSAQRLGRWDEADKYFGLVQELAPGSPIAADAKRHQGARAFQVQLATLSDAKAAAAAAAQLRKQGVAATSAADANNPSLSVIRVGPLATFSEAKAMKARFAAQYANAIILP